MTDEEFHKHFKFTMSKNSDFDIDWATHIKKNLALLPIECVELMSNNKPSDCWWSEDIVEAAKAFMVENIILVD